MRLLYLFSTLFLLVFSGCSIENIRPIHRHTYDVNIAADSITFAIIGDYGDNTPEEAKVADMVRSWSPEFIITAGDNNYPNGGKTIDRNVGGYYGDFIYNPDAPAKWQCKKKASVEAVNRFFPSPGNHDNRAFRLRPYLDFFTLPGDEKNYEFSWGPVSFYSIDTKHGGHLSYKSSKAAAWLRKSVATSKRPFQFVYFHHPPFSQGAHGSNKHMQWPYSSLGIDAVLAGHDHMYERILDKTDTAQLYLVVGNSGNDHLYKCTTHPLDKERFSVYCDDTNFGAVKVKVNGTTAVFEYYSISDPKNPLDVHIIRK